jgi:hypothetical protein
MIEQKAHGHNEQHSSVLINPWRMHSTDLRSRKLAEGTPNAFNRKKHYQPQVHEHYQPQVHELNHPSSIQTGPGSRCISRTQIIGPLNVCSQKKKGAGEDA